MDYPYVRLVFIFKNSLNINEIGFIRFVSTTENPGLWQKKMITAAVTPADMVVSADSSAAYDDKIIITIRNSATKVTVAYVFY